MNPDIAIRIAGVLAVFAAVGHGYLGDKMLVKQKFEPEHLKSFIRACYQFGSVAWLAGGILFLLVPNFLSGSERSIVVYCLVPVYLFASLVNAWFTKAKHPGWVMLLAVVVFAIMGVIL